MRRFLRRRLFGLGAMVLLVVVACVVSSTNRGVPFSAGGADRWVLAPIKAHLDDGSIALFRNGAMVGSGGIRGRGMQYTATLDSAGGIDSISLDHVVGIEVVEREVNAGRTLVYAPVSGIASTIAVAVIALALFGSCPTIYADSAGTAALQAESFSYSIAPLLAKRDVDRLNVTPDANGVIRLEVRNEALETHYIDQLELLETRHAANEIVVPAARGGLVAVKNLTSHFAADSRGRDVTRELAVEDGVAFSSSDAVVSLAANSTDAAEDFIEITVPRLAGRDSLALVLKARSSLLSTTIFYDHMLARHGSRALDWVGRDLSHITTVASVAKWYTDHFGLRVSVRDGDRWRQVVRLMDFGPTAWRDVAAIVPGLRDVQGDSVHLRLSFVADEYRIDRVATSFDVRRVEPKVIHVARVTGSDGERRDDVRDFLTSADDRRLVTNPGDRFYTHFDVGTAPAGTRTWLVAADGYYVEWVRPSWIVSAADSLPFSSRTSTQDILRTWLAGRDSLERRFFRDRVPVQ